MSEEAGKEQEERVIRVGRATSTIGLSRCIYAVATKEKLSEIRLRGVGASAVNQIAKGIAKASGNLYSKGISVTTSISFQDVESKLREEPDSSLVFLLKFDSI